MTTTDHQCETTSTHNPADPNLFPLVDPYPPFSWVAPTDTDIAALLAAGGDFEVIADDCGHVESYGLVETTPCGLRLCDACAATHTHPSCDAAYRDGGED